MINFEITAMQLFDYKELRQINDDEDSEYSYSVNIIINDRFMLQISSSLEELPDTDTFEKLWNTEEEETEAFEEYALSRILDQKTFEEYALSRILDQISIEIDRDWFIKAGAEIMNPENSP